MQLLLTGATGFVGRNLLVEALKSGRYETIWLPVRSPKKMREQLAVDGFATVPPSVKLIEASAADWNLGEAAKAEHVVHSAGVIFARTLEEYREVNVEGTMRLLRALKTPVKVILLSSLSASGPSREEEPTLESDTDNPITWYGKSKLEMEQRVTAEFGHINYLFLRPPMIFGARDHATLPLFKMVKRPFLFKPGFKCKKYSYVSVGDLVSAIFTALDSRRAWGAFGHRHFYITHETVITDEQLLTCAAEVSGKRGMLVRIPQPLLWAVSRVIDRIPTWRATIPSLSVDRAKEIWPSRWVASSKAFQQAFGWEARGDFKAVLKETRDWYLKTGQLHA